jgi:hypothetical protein
MKEDALELNSAWRFYVTNREKTYWLTAKLFKSKLILEDEIGNKIAIHKRLKKLRIERKGNVEWLID